LDAKTYKSEIFISHSCKEPCLAPTEDVAARRRFAISVRDKILDFLKENDLGYFVDKENIEVGTKWRASINKWLGICSGGIILFNEEAAKSEWVKYEASILTWKCSLDANFLLIPVFLGDFKPKRLEENGFSATDILSTQAIKIQEGEEEKLLEELRHLVKSFNFSKTNERNIFYKIWIDNIAKCLDEPINKTGETWKCIAENLIIDDVSLSRFDRRHYLVAHQIVNTKSSDIYSLNEPLKLIFASIKDDSNKESLAKYLHFLWVDISNAQMLITSNFASRRKIIFINIKTYDYAKDYVNRAYCRHPQQNYIIDCTNIVSGEEPDEKKFYIKNVILRHIRSRTKLSVSEFDFEIEKFGQKNDSIYIVFDYNDLDNALIELIKTFPENICSIIIKLPINYKVNNLEIKKICFEIISNNKNEDFRDDVFNLAS